MRRTCYLLICTVYLITASILLLRAAYASAPDTKAAPRRGIAVLASSIGSDYSPEGLANLVQQWKLSPVVIDWAWITYHWDKTDFAAVNRFLELMAAKKVPVAAMYRPRFLNQPTVPTQVDGAGKPAASHGYYICFSSPEARQWGIAWGTRILQKLPQINEIIIYNPLNQCQCPACQAAARGNPYAQYDAVWKFLAEAKAAWQKQKAGAKLGVVFVNDPEFWRRGAQVVDVAHPFLFITDNTDIAKDAAEASAIRDLLPGKTGPCLAKITWGPNDKVSPARLAEFDKSAAEAGLPYFFWTFDTLSDPSLYDQKAVARLLSTNQLAPTTSTGGKQGPLPVGAAQLTPAPAREVDLPATASSPQPGVGEPGNLMYSPEQIRSISAETFLDRIAIPEPGYQQFAALNALIQKARESDAATRGQVLSLVIAAMKDKSRPVYQRWQCCYVISDSQYEQGVPDLIQVLLHDESEIVRSVAAEALGDLDKNAKSAAAHEGLLEAARQETSPQVRETLAKHLGPDMPAAESRPAPAAIPAPAPAAARAADEEASAASPQPGEYTREAIRRTSAEAFLERMLNPEPGYWEFAAMNALAQKAKESDAATRGQILSLVIAAMKDKSRPVYQRWQCCYVLSGSGDEQVVPELIEVLLHDESDRVRPAAAEALADFPKSAAAHDALLQAARQDTSPTVREVLARRLGQDLPASAPGTAPEAAAGQSKDGNYTAEEIRRTSAEVFLERMLNPEPGYEPFAALNALAQKAKESDAVTRRPMLSLVTAAMEDTSRPVYQRYQCCYVLSGCGDERAVPDLIQVLLHDESDLMRSVAAEALGDLDKNAKSAAAHDGLLQAARQETSPQVREVLTRRLSQEMPAAAAGGTGPPAGFMAGERDYTADEIRDTPVETFLDRMAAPISGYQWFADLHALTRKAEEGDANTREAIRSLVTAAMKDTSRSTYQRYQCCYVLSGLGDERVIPDLIQVMREDAGLCGFAAEALANLAKDHNSTAAHDALLQAARQNAEVREVVTRRLGEAMPAAPSVPAAAPVEERAPTGPPEPPPGPARPVEKPLPWPFPGGQEDQIIFNNYQQATDAYIHCGLDFIQPAGTPVTAVDSGYVAAIYTNYPEWTTHYFFIVTPERGGSEGWCYTHLDPRTFTFREGDFVRQGERLGSLVDFSVGNEPGVSHLHLQYVRFSRDASGKVNVHSLLDPLYFFDWKDTEAPVFQPLRFVTEDMSEQFPADAAGVVTVSGRVDVLAAVTDSAYPGHMGNLGVPVVMLSISDRKHTMQKLVVDHRGDVGDETQVKPLYLSDDQKKAFFDPYSFPRYQMLRVTKTDGDGRIEPRDVRECWNTAERDLRGRPLWPNGQYSVNVYAWDIAGNRAVVGAVVQVRNR